VCDLLAEIEKYKKQNAELKAETERLEEELEAINSFKEDFELLADILPNDERYMDPPDGGNTSLSTQIGRMVAELKAKLQIQHSSLGRENAELKNSVDFYKSRCDALHATQTKMRDPERKAICDILANGTTYVYKEVTEPKAKEAQN